MSHDVMLQRLDYGEAGICSPEETKACIALLKPVFPDGHDLSERGNITLPGGSNTEVNPSFKNSAFESIMFHLRGFSDEMAAFIFKLAQAGDFIIFDTSGEGTPESPMAYATTQAALDRMGIGEDEIPNPCLCESPEHFIRMIRGGFEAWKSFRDSVLGD